MVYVTRDLVTVLLERAEEASPESVSISLAATPAGEFDADLRLDPDAPVITHFYLPEAGQSVSAVFGIDLGTPAGRGRARFVSHPSGPLELRETDDLAGVVLVAVPPWEVDAVAAVDRNGRELHLEFVDAEPPIEEFEAE